MVVVISDSTVVISDSTLVISDISRYQWQYSRYPWLCYADIRTVWNMLLWPVVNKMRDVRFVEDEGTTIIRNVRKHSVSNTESHLRRLKSSATLLWRTSNLTPSWASNAILSKQKASLQTHSQLAKRMCSSAWVRLSTDAGVLERRRNTNRASEMSNTTKQSRIDVRDFDIF